MMGDMADEATVRHTMGLDKPLQSSTQNWFVKCYGDFNLQKHLSLHFWTKAWELRYV